MCQMIFLESNPMSKPTLTEEQEKRFLSFWNQMTTWYFDVGTNDSSSQSRYCGEAVKQFLIESLSNQREELAQATKEAVEAERTKHIEIYRWLCGYYDFPERGKFGAYWWRSHLMQKLKNIGIDSLTNPNEE